MRTYIATVRDIISLNLCTNPEKEKGTFVPFYRHEKLEALNGAKLLAEPFPSLGLSHQLSITGATLKNYVIP